MLPALILPALLCACETPAPLPLAIDVAHLIDPSGALTAGEAAARDRDFRPTPGTPPTLGRVAGATWFRLRIAGANKKTAGSNEKTAGPESRTILLELISFGAEKLEVFQEGRRIYRGGINVPFDWRAIPHRNLVVPVELDATQPTELLVRLQTRATTELPLRAWRPADFRAASLVEYYVLGIFLGCVAIMAGYNLFLWLSIRERAYFFYVIYSLAMSYFVLDQDGIVTHLFRTGENFRPWSFVVASAILGPAAALLAESFLSLNQISPRLARLLRLYAVLSGASILLGFSDLSYPVLLGLINFELALLLVLVVAGAMVALVRRIPEAFVLAAAFLPVILMGCYRLLWFFGIFGDTNWLFLHGMKVAIVLELLILSLGLAGRYNRLRARHLATLVRAADERRRLTGEVHDNIGGLIGAALLQLREGGQTRRARAILETALRNVRDFAAVISLGDRPETTLEDEARDFARTYSGIRGFMIEVKYDPRINEVEDRTRIHLMRVLQEWVSNCMRHGRARVFQVEFRASPRRALRVRSDGAAFAYDSARAPALAGYGLRGIGDRTRELGGRARSRAGPDGRGCLFVLRF